MRLKLTQLWEYLRASFWFVPAIMVCAATVLAFGTLTIDEVLTDWPKDVPWVYTGGAEGARGVLSVIASSTVTVTGVVFSITVVALTLASNQFGPRLLRNFMRDAGNQFALGAFVAIYVYCILVLRTVRGDEHDWAGFIPHVSVTVAVALAIIGAAVLIYFIHHAAAMIQAPNVIAAVAADLHDAIDRMYPQRIGESPRDPEMPDEQELAAQAPEDLERHADAVRSPRAGYLQAVDPDQLMRLAAEHDLVVLLLKRPGRYFVHGEAMAYAWPRGRANEAVRASLGEVFLLGSQRTMTQDVEFAIEQLVEVAVRALSPGTNDPFTAIACLDALADALCRLADRRMPSPHRADEHGKLRVIAHPLSFPGIVEAAFNQIRQYGRSSAAVTVRGLEALELIARCARTEEQRSALRRQAEIIERQSRDALPEELDRHDVQERYARVIARLEVYEQ